MNLYIQNKEPCIILLGDIMLDHQIIGTCHKISNEAPVPVINYKSESFRIGGCGNVLMNMIALGATKIFLFSIIGDDPHGKQLCELLPPIVENYIIRCPNHTTTTKHRIYSDRKLIARYDQEEHILTTHTQEEQIINQINDIVKHYTISSVVFSDYNKGFLTESLCQNVITCCNQYSIISVVDPKENYRKYNNCTIIKPNRVETKHIFGINLSITPLCEAHERIHALMNCKTSIITLSEDGISAYSNQTIYHYRTDVKEVIDVTGAGDIVCSILGVYYPYITDINILLQIASHLASISISHVGVYTITASDLIYTYRLIYGTKNISMSLIPHLQERIIFTNGCFDLLHSAHVELFKFCKQLGGIVIVGLNSDCSIKRLKGESRPIYSLEDRIKILEGLEYIDFIIPFDETTPLEIIKTIRPYYLVKGGDYTPESIIGKEYATEIIIFNYIHGKSTTQTITNCQFKYQC
jgi:D-beta-D-heptose 7-phosphate kinase/D-beta-D-heptose 1-phosphate adenosyltransferase